MSQENVEIVRRVYESFERRDWDSMGDLFDPNVEQHGTVGGIEEGHVARGLPQVRQIWEKEDDEIWDEHRFEPQEFIDAGDQVVVFQREYQRGKSSGVELVVDTASILDLRGGRIVRMQGYMDRAAALRAIGSRRLLSLRDTARTMSQENVELLHRAIDAINRRDLDAHLALMDDDVEIVPRTAAMEGSYHGHDGYRRWWGNQFDAFPDFTIELGEVRDLGDVTIAPLHLRGHGAGSNVPFDGTVWYVGRWRRGKCVWWGNFDTRVEALEAVGLSE